ncbi:MAG: Lrp/AsnC family transcriptional regulator [bacterium]
MHAEKLDKIDIAILKILQENSRTKRNELAESVKLTIPAVSERLRKLEDFSVIRHYTTLVDARKIHLEVTAFIFVMADSSTYFPEIIEKAKRHDEILECHAITGGGSHLLKVRTQSTASLERLLSKIQAWDGVKNTSTNIVLSSPKETTALPLDHLQG